MRKGRLIAGLAVTGLIAIGSVRPLFAACESCKPDRIWYNAYCTPVAQEETGVTDCRPVFFDTYVWCMESGTFCSWVDAGGGGGGGGTGGGGGGTCSPAPGHLCPAECFSCTGGGGGSGWGYSV